MTTLTEWCRFAFERVALCHGDGTDLTHEIAALPVSVSQLKGAFWPVVNKSAACEHIAPKQRLITERSQIQLQHGQIEYGQVVASSSRRMQNCDAGVMQTAEGETAVSGQVDGRGTGEGQAQLLDQRGIDTSGLRAGIKQGTRLDRGRNRAQRSARLLGAGGTPAHQGIDQGAFILQYPFQEGPGASF
jgi:hypothetical protein